MTASTTPMFTSTIAALNPALSLMPMTRMMVMTTVISTAGRLNHANAWVPDFKLTYWSTNSSLVKS